MTTSNCNSNSARPQKTSSKNQKELIGRRYGMLVLLGPDHGRFWYVQCDCGAKVSRRKSNLLKGDIKSCGCLRRSRGFGADLTGKRSGELLVLKKSTVKYKWLCQCSCGAVTDVATASITSGKTKSCGCVQRKGASERAKARNTKHGLSKNPVFHTYLSMMGRCYSEGNKSYPRYGGRGITVCDSWKDNPKQFVEDMGSKPSKDHSIDRIDNDKGYSPDNCRWATKEEQNRNKECNRLNESMVTEMRKKKREGWDTKKIWKHIAPDAALATVRSAVYGHSWKSVKEKHV